MSMADEYVDDLMSSLARHGYYHVVQETGRMSSKNPNRGNPPRSKEEYAMGINTVVVQFQQLSTGSVTRSVSSAKMVDSYTSKRYHYLTNRDDIEVGGWVIVWSPIFDAPALARIVEVLWNTKSGMAWKRIVDVVDIDAYQMQLREEADAAAQRAQRAKRVSEIQHEIAKKRQSVEQQLVDERMNSDPWVQLMEAELRGLQSLG